MPAKKSFWNTNKTIEKCIYDFVWNKTDRIKRKTMINDLQNGGLNMLDMESKVISLKAAWIPRIIKCERYASVCNMYLKRESLSLSMLLSGNIAKSSILKNQVLPDFYVDCITSFNKCKSNTEVKDMNIHEYCTQPIWCNRHFLSKGKCLLYKHWISSGFKYVKDLYDENGNFISEAYLMHRLKDKSNWMVEYLIVRRTIDKFSQFDMSQCKYENIHEDRYLYNLVIRNCIYKVKELKSKFIYECMIKKK